MKLHKVTFLLLVIGGVNWLVFGLLGWDIVGKIFGGMDSTISKIVYIVVGLSAVYELMSHKKMCKGCDSGMKPQGGMPNQQM